MSESLQHKLDRVRRPRVQITYDVETGGALEQKELPFVVGVMADLTGQPAEPLKPVKERKFVPIDRDNFNEVLAKSTPRVAMRVQNQLTDENTELSVELKFQSIDDFRPYEVAKQIEPLAELLEIRNRLNQMLSKMEGNDRLSDLLSGVLSDGEKAKSLADDLGLKLDGADPSKN